MKLAIALPGFYIIGRLSREYVIRRRHGSIEAKPVLDGLLRSLAWSMAGFLVSGTLIVLGHRFEWSMWLRWPFLGATVLSLVVTLIIAFRIGYHSID